MRYRATAPSTRVGWASRSRAAGHLAGAPASARVQGSLGLAPRPTTRPEGCAVGGDRPAGSARSRQQQQEHRDLAVREGQALLSDLRYSVSQAGLGEGGRQAGGGGVKETFCAAARSPSLLSELAGISSRKGKGLGGGARVRSQRGSACGRPALVGRGCPRAWTQGACAPLDFGGTHRVTQDPEEALGQRP